MEGLFELLFFGLIIGFGLLMKIIQSVSGTDEQSQPEQDPLERRESSEPDKSWEDVYGLDNKQGGGDQQESRRQDRRPQSEQTLATTPSGRSNQDASRAQETPTGMSRSKSSSVPPATYEAQTSSYHTTEAVDTKAAKPDHSDAWQTGREINEESLRRAFPKANQLMHRWHQQQREPITVSMKSRKVLRQAVLMNEVISRPRAFDV